MRNRIKFIALIICAILLLFSVFIGQTWIAISGLAVYIIFLLMVSYDIYVASKAYGNERKKEKEDDKRNLMDKISGWIEGAIIFFGLTMYVIGDDIGANMQSIGLYIWLSSIFAYFLNGILVQAYANIPLEFGYGGWRLKRFRRGSRKGIK